MTRRTEALVATARAIAAELLAWADYVQPGNGGSTPTTPADASAFRPATEFVRLGVVKTYRQLMVVLAKNPWIQRHKPRKQRLLVHAGDLMRCCAARGTAAFESMDQPTPDVADFLDGAAERQWQMRENAGS